MNRLGHALNNTEIYSQTYQIRAVESRTDYAYWMAQMARHEIVRQASMAMLSTAMLFKNLTITSMIININPNLWRN